MDEHGRFGNLCAIILILQLILFIAGDFLAINRFYITLIKLSLSA